MIAERFIAEAIIALLNNAVTDQLLAYMEQEGSETQPFETVDETENRWTKKPSAIVSITTAERSEKDRILKNQVYQVIIDIRVNGENGKRDCYTYGAAISQVIDNDPTIGGLVTNTAVTEKNYTFPRFSGDESDHQATIIINITQEAEA